MTMNKWKISDAKARLSEVVALSRNEPQILFNRQKPVAALIGIEQYEKFAAFYREQQKPSISELLVELQQINETEEEMQEPLREDRPMEEFDPSL